MTNTDHVDRDVHTNADKYKYFGIALTLIVLVYQLLNGGYAEVMFVTLNGMLLVVSSERVASSASYQAFRTAFSNSVSTIARALTVVAAVGGNLIIFDVIASMNFFPNDTVEAIAKRLAPPTLIVFVFFYLFSFFSNRISRSTFKRNDLYLRKFEFFLYLTSAIATLLLYVLFLGIPVEVGVLSHDDEKNVAGFAVWTERPFQFVLASTLSTFIWFVAFLLCYLSRMSELVQFERR